MAMALVAMAPVALPPRAAPAALAPVARRDLAAKATQLNEFIISHAPSFAQKAGETALAEGDGGPGGDDY